MWLLICLITSALFLIFWFWFGPRLIEENKIKRLFVKLILLIITADGISTLLAQPGYYWKDYLNCDELAFLGEKLLQLHPLAFVFGIILWIVLITYLIKKLNLFLSSVIFFSVSIGHSIGFWQGQLKPVIEDVFKIDMTKTIYEEIFSYVLYLSLGLIFAYALAKIWKSKST